MKTLDTIPWATVAERMPLEAVLVCAVFCDGALAIRLMYIKLRPV